MDAIALYGHYLFVLCRCTNTTASIKANLIPSKLSRCCSGLQKNFWTDGDFPDKERWLSAMLTEGFLNCSQLRQADTSLLLQVTNMLIKED